MNTPHASSLAYRPDIDGLRAFAVLSVVVYHAFPTLLEAGFIGVDVFFVISGYLISGIILNDLQQGSFSLWNFYSRRIRRIFPALIVVLAAVLIFGWFALFPDEYRALGRHVFGGAAFISNFFLWQEAGYFDVAAKAKPLLHLWSLGIEEQFYIAFPLLLWCCAKKHFRVTTVILVLCVASFLDNLYCMPHPTVNFYNPLARVWELLAGAALCAFMRQPSAKGTYLKLDALAGKLIRAGEQENDGRSLSLALALLGAALLCIALLLVREGEAYPGWKALLPVSGTVLLLAAGSSNPVSRHLLGNRFAVFTGLVSYPFYLWHWALISLAFIINGGLDASTLLLRIVLVAASFLLAVLTYFLVEKPLRFGARARSGKVYALIIGMIMVGAAGLSVWLTDGLPDRKNIKKFAAITRHQELPVLMDKTGFAYAGIEEGMLRYCRYTDVGAKESVAIIGDSHAWSAYSGIAQLGRELGYNTILLGLVMLGSEIVNPDGKQAQETGRALTVLKEKHDIRKVFISAYGEEVMRYIARHLKIGLTRHAHADAGEVLRKTLQSYVDTLRASGKEVFILAGNPVLPAPPREYLGGRPFIPAKKLPDTVQISAEHAQYLHVLSKITGATVIDVIGPMCPGGKCMVFTDDGLPLYVDRHHLSPVGSEFQAKRILKPYLTR